LAPLRATFGLNRPGMTAIVSSGFFNNNLNKKPKRGQNRLSIKLVLPWLDGSVL
jgi:hypothetical protein